MENHIKAHIANIVITRAY